MVYLLIIIYFIFFLKSLGDIDNIEAMSVSSGTRAAVNQLYADAEAVIQLESSDDEEPQQPASPPPAQIIVILLF